MVPPKTVKENPSGNVDRSRWVFSKKWSHITNIIHLRTFQKNYGRDFLTPFCNLKRYFSCFSRIPPKTVKENPSGNVGRSRWVFSQRWSHITNIMGFQPRFLPIWEANYLAISKKSLPKMLHTLGETSWNVIFIYPSNWPPKVWKRVICIAWKSENERPKKVVHLFNQKVLHTLVMAQMYFLLASLYQDQMFWGWVVSFFFF